MPGIPSSVTPNWADRLLVWYARERRDLPWRRDPRPYYVWLSEMMLQQTQVATVVPYFERFISAFPTIHGLAAADQQEVLKLWEGLGYYARGRNLHKAAKVIASELGGEFPNDLEGLQKLPGIGPYTAAAIVSIAFNRPHPVVDGNVLRVFARFWGVDEDIRSTRIRTSFRDRLTPVIEATEDRSAFNQAIMELGALVCTPKAPACDACPLRNECVARSTDRVAELPFKSPSKPVPHYDIAVAVIVDEGKVLIAKRDERKMLGGLWEFPGGKHEPGETLAETAVRETCEETGLEVETETLLCTVKHAYSHFKITLTAFVCRVVGGELGTSRPMTWVAVEELGRFPFPKANIKVLEALGSR